MKNFLLFFLTGVACILLTACNKFKSEEQPLTGNLVTFTAPGNTEGSVFTGVKIKDTDKVLIPADDYMSISADEFFIFAYKDDKTFVYDLDARPYDQGVYTNFTKVNDAPNCYIASTPNNSYCYFINNKAITAENHDTPVLTGNEAMAAEETEAITTVTGRNILPTEKILFIEKEDNLWEGYNYEGQPLFSTNSRIWLVRLQGSEEEYILIPTTDKKPSCAVYDTTGKQIKTLNRYAWKALQPKLEINQVEINSSVFSTLLDGTL